MNKPDWLSMQYNSFERFFSKDSPLHEISLNSILEKLNHIKLDDNHTLTIENWSLDEAPLGAEECLNKNKTYCRDLWFDFSVTGPRVGKEAVKFFRCMIHLPAPTRDSEFIISSKDTRKANRYAFIMQLAFSPGLYYSEKKNEVTISPVIGKKIICRAKGDRQTFWMDGLNMSLNEFKMLLDHKGFSDDDRVLLSSIYKYLDSKKQIPEDHQIPSPEKSNITDLAFIRDIFVAYLESFNMSMLGKKQMSSLIRNRINKEDARLNIEELQLIIDFFTDRRLPDINDRSLKYRKVKLIGDFLFQYMNNAMLGLKKRVIEQWIFWKSSSIKESGSGVKETSEITYTASLSNALVPYLPFKDLKKNVFTNNELFQLLDDTNPLSEISQKRRLTFRGPGGIPEKLLYLEKRDVHPIDFGRICPVETPQGENLGFNLYLARDARINSLGLIEARYFDLSSNEEIFLDPYEEEEKEIIFRTEDNYPNADAVYAKTRTEEISLCKTDKITHSTYSPHGFLGYAASLIPFFQHNDANRALMGAGMIKQALPLVNTEPPIIVTGIEDEIANNYNRPSLFIEKKRLCFGRNLLVGYMPWDLLNYEDAVVISDRLVQKDLLTHIEMEEKFFDEERSEEKGIFEQITRDNEHIDKSLLINIDGNGVIEPGSRIEPGDILVSKLRSKKMSAKAGDDRLISKMIISLFGEKLGGENENASLYAPDYIRGVAKEVEWITDRRILPLGVKRRVRIVIETQKRIRVGDKLTGRHGNKGVISKILPECEMPCYKSQDNHCGDNDCRIKDPHTHLDILLNPLTITGRMNLGQLYETTLGWMAARQNIEEYTVPPFAREWSWDEISSKLKGNSLSGKQTVYFYRDGKEIKLEQPVTVGYQYFLKLKARDQFAYSPITGQPDVPSVKDEWERRAVNKRTPQKIGEMEAWALEGHSAWNILDELLSMKSDEEVLRQKIVEYAREISKSKESLNYDFLTPLVQREHRALKTFIYYCRAMGLEIEGINKDEKNVPLVGVSTPRWPEIVGISIRLAGDDERKKWSNKRIVKNTGTERDGLWSTEIFGNLGSYIQDERICANNATAIIELPVPIDNPLFRPVLELLLDKEGYVLDAIEKELQNLLHTLYPGISWDWDAFWKEERKKRSNLQTVDELLDWLETFSDDKMSYTRQELAQYVGKSLSKKPQINFRKVFDPVSPYYQDAGSLYHHFEVMDLKKTIRHLEGIPTVNAKERRLIALINTLIKNDYHPILFFIKNILVLPKNLRFERKQGRGSADPQYENDLNYLYRLIILQNKRIKTFIDRKAPDIVLKEQEERLRTLVYGLLVNDKGSRYMEEPLRRQGNGRVLSSILSQITGDKSGKEGIFRSHLLGKRVDFSGRGVIVPDPDLDVDEAGLPYSTGRMLFRDLMINRAIQRIPEKEDIIDDKGNNTGRFRRIPYGIRLSKAKKYLKDEQNYGQVRKWLDELARENLILLNRAPSLHRLSMLAFRIRFYEEDDVIRLNPYVCAPFNADFDGDTMAVHMPMLPGSIEDAKRMLPSMALRSPGHGGLVVNYKADIALALYLLTQTEEGRKKISELLPVTCNTTIAAQELYELFDKWQKQNKGNFSDSLKKLTPVLREVLRQSGFSLGVEDFLLEKDIKEYVEVFEKEYQKSVFSSQDERIEFWHNKILEIRKILDDKLSELDSTNPISILNKSKAAKVEFAQISGMRGIMLRPGGRYVNYPVCSNIVDGMSPLEYFVSCHGSRHGLADKGLMTGPAGDLTNILIQAGQDIFIVEDDCKTEHGLWISEFDDPAGGYIGLKERITGRCLAEEIHLNQKKYDVGTMIDSELSDKLIMSGKDWIKIRSPITCQAVDIESELWKSFLGKVKGKSLASGDELDENTLLSLARLRIPTIDISRGDEKEKESIQLPPVNGICKRCYGLDLSTEKFPPEGYPAGVIAAQSIGEPGTQLTLRTFHVGGIAGQEISEGLNVARKAFSAGIIQEPLKSSLKGTAKIIKSPNGLDWLEIEGEDLDGKEGYQRLPVIDHEPISGWTPEMEQKLCNEGSFIFNENIQKDGRRILSMPGVKAKFITVNKDKAFPVTIGQRIYLTNRCLNTQTVNVNLVCKRYGPLSAAEYLLHLFQKIYNANSQVADHHFEVIVRRMMDKLTITESNNSRFDKGNNISLGMYLSSKRKPLVRLQTTLKAGLNASGFLARFAFRQISRHLREASLNREIDWLQGLKEKVITGQMLKMKRECRDGFIEKKG